MTIEFFAIQIIGFLGTILFFLSYQCRSNKTLFRVQFLSYLCYTVHLLLLGAATIGGYTFSARKIRLTGMLINSPLWILYDIAVGSYAGILDEMVSEASMLISIIRFGWKNMDAFEQSP